MAIQCKGDYCRYRRLPGWRYCVDFDARGRSSRLPARVDVQGHTPRCAARQRIRRAIERTLETCEEVF